jgi:O-antigen/teichoic acid export membrane protein
MNKSNQTIIQFIKTSGFFFVGSVLSKAITILMLPLYTSYIPAADMGYYDVTLAYLTIATSVLFFDIWVAILRFMYDADTLEGKASYVRNGLLIFLMSSAIYMLVGVVLCFLSDVKYIGWFVFYGLSSNIANIFTFVARGYGYNIKFGISGIISSCANVTFNLVLILCFSLDYQSLYISGVAGFLLQSLYLLLSLNILPLLKKSTMQLSIIKSMFKYSLPLCLNSVSYWLLTSFSRIVINFIHGDSANGIYAIGNKFSFLITLVTTCFTYAWQDIAFSNANKLADPGKFYSSACNLYCKVLALGMAVMLPIIKLFFPLLVRNEYVAAAETVPLFLIVAIVAAISTFIGNVFYAIKYTKAIFYSMLISAMLNVLLSFPLIKLLGINGANISVTLSFIVNILIRNRILYEKINFRLDLQILWIVALIALSYGVYSLLSIWFNIIMLIIIICVAVFIFRDNLRDIKLVFSKGRKNYD